ncbi:MAG TPA: DnaJ domain-containing protein [Pirellulales bacterium]|nr:DnaJ domain-containing protein [Pirellulales bacterium]
MTPTHPNPASGGTVHEFLAVLGLQQPVTVDDVKQAYLEKAKTTHPDHGGDPQQFKRLQRAFEQATEYARFKSGRMKWLSECVAQYVEQQQLVADIQALGGSLELETVDWLVQSIGSDFAQVLDRIITVRLSGSKIDDGVVAELVEHRRDLAALHRLELTHTSVTQDGLVQLKTFENLRELDLSGTPVSLSTVEWLVSRLDQLQSLVLSDTGLGSLSRLKLRFANRNLKIAF